MRFAVSVIGLGLGLLVANPGSGLAATGSVGVQGTASDLFDYAADDFDGGPGINFFGTYRLNETFDARFDAGARFLEGNETLNRAFFAAPDLGARRGELTGNARVLPFTLDLVYRGEKWSQGRFWLPYVAVGLGFYDMEIEYIGADQATLDELHDEAEELDMHPENYPEVVAGEARTQHVYEFGWNAKLGVNLYRTSGMFVNLESGVHGIQTDERWQPMWDVAIGIGALLPVD
ncbi:MAG: outer membrane beta-barrel protein [Candidatus Eisenbacteria bacterium]|uniref:Outer membrane beta-barrel protein n=1 Tax=Eiseniibacteriota bacterium TaxID=2212470 RepID=A0A956N963_UNCEI|nr:outer membrane beta-barrel protein [Candidatus Eisenbacteria bacterium]